MRFVHPSHPGRAVRMCYCLNVVGCEDQSTLRRTLADVCEPVRERVSPDGELGVGLHLPAELAFALAADGAELDRRRLRDELKARGLTVFSANAFPFAGFHRAGLKRGVFSPGWDERERAQYTAAVARVLTELVDPGESHVSISTHSGLHRDEPRALERVAACGRGLAEAVLDLATIEQRSGTRMVLSIEPEPRSLAGDTREFTEVWPQLLAALFLELERRGANEPQALVTRHVGLCLDTCHAAVEFESSDDAAQAAARLGLAVGKVQVSSALRLPQPGRDDAGRARLLALDEPVYLHQLTARGSTGLLRTSDLSELRRELAGADAAKWLAADEWRCHFHVPVDAPEPLPNSGGLTTTAAEGARTLAAFLGDLSLWGTRDLHVEVETYTFDVLPPELRAGGLVAGLAGELDWTRAHIEAAGWRSDSAAREHNGE